MLKYKLIILLIAIIFAPAFSLVHGAEIEGSIFKEDVSERDTQLRLVGVGLLRYWGIKAYKGAFYLEKGADTSSFSTDNAQRIELEYMRPFKGEDFGRATDSFLKKNLDPETLRRLRSQIEYHNSLYEDVTPGDRYALTYIPGVGTELSLNGVPKGTVEGAEFAAAIFSIWVGSNPISEPFKKQILGQS